MALQITGDTENNRLDIDATVLRDYSGTIHCSGKGNEIIIGKQAGARGNININLDQRNKVKIGSQCHIGYLTIFARHDAVFEIGNRCVFNGQCTMQAHEPGRIILGDGCLIASDTNFTTSDMHGIFDVETGLRINFAADVVLGDRVWVGARAFILKGCQIGSGSIIGLGTICTSNVPENAVMAGNPGRIVKTGVSWRHDLGGAAVTA